MTMRRGDLVTAVMAGDHGKPRPAVIVQSDALPESDSSVFACPLTSALVEGARFRVTIDPSTENAVLTKLQIMADKPTTTRRARIGRQIGRLARGDVVRLNQALAFTLGFADLG